MKQIAERDRRIAELEAELAAAKETCRRWERLCETLCESEFEFVVSPEGYVRKLGNGKWEAFVLSGFRKVVDRPTDGIAAIEAWEKENA